MLKPAIPHIRCKGSQLGSELHCRNVRGLKETVVVGKLQHLSMRSVRQLLSTVASVHAPQATHRVQDFFTLRVPHINAFSPTNNARASRVQIFEIGKGMQIMCAIQKLNMGSVDHGAHAAIPDSLWCGFKHGGANAPAPTEISLS